MLVKKQSISCASSMLSCCGEVKAVHGTGPILLLLALELVLGLPHNFQENPLIAVCRHFRLGQKDFHEPQLSPRFPVLGGE
jgi:hypothetical protein